MKRRKELGQALIAAIAGLGVVLMGFAGLGIDMGYLRYEKRLQQTAADNAALAGAAELQYSNGYASAAQHDAAANGFTNGANNVTVTVNNPPQSGPHAGAAGYVEVYVAQVQPTFFMRILRINSETVTARAVASGNANSAGCIYVLGTSSTAINLSGGETITASSCGVIDDGGLQINNGARITAASIGVAGSVSQSGGSTVSPTPTAGIVPAPDPLAYLTPPTPASPCIPDPNIGNGKNTTLSHGTYCSLTIGGGATVTFNPGVYIITGSFTANNGSTLIGNSGVMFYETAGTMSLAGGTNLNFTAPTASNPVTGASAGILFWQAASDTDAATIDNGANDNLTGAFYFPNATLNLAGGSNTTTYTILVAKGITSSNGANLVINSDYSSLPGGSPIKTATLVE